MKKMQSPRAFTRFISNNDISLIYDITMWYIHIKKNSHLALNVL